MDDKIRIKPIGIKMVQDQNHTSTIQKVEIRTRLRQGDGPLPSNCPGFEWALTRLMRGTLPSHHWPVFIAAQVFVRFARPAISRHSTHSSLLLFALGVGGSPLICSGCGGSQPFQSSGTTEVWSLPENQACKRHHRLSRQLRCLLKRGPCFPTPIFSCEHARFPLMGPNRCLGARQEHGPPIARH